MIPGSSRPAAAGRKPFRLLLLALCLQACLSPSPDGEARPPASEDPDGRFPPVDSARPNPPWIPRGYYAFGFPDSLRRLNLDSAYQVSWSASDSAGNDPLRISLYKAGARITDLWPSPSPSGSHKWDLAQYRFLDESLRSGNDYQFRATNLADSSTWDFSPYFTLYSAYSGTFAFTSPAEGVTATLGTRLRVAWSSTGNVGTSAVLVLYKGNTRVVTAQTPVPIAGGIDWPVASPLGSGGEYHVRIYSKSDPSLARMGPSFTIASAYSGAYAFLSPASADTLRTGVTARAAWTTSGNPGPQAELSLWRDTFQVADFGPTVSAAQDTFLWTPAVGTRTGTYRLRLASLSDGSISAYSAPFSIQGVPQDAYESDNTATSARPIAVGGAPQAHTLTLKDEDWTYFTAAKGLDYRVSVAPEGYSARILVEDTAGRVVADHHGTEIGFGFTAGYAGLYYLIVFPDDFDGLSYPDFGAYSISIR